MFNIWQNLYEHFGRERDGGKELPVLATRSNRLRMLDNYITVGSSSPVVWFEDAERPKTITEENILKSRSAFAPYHVKKLRGVEVDNSDDENQRGGKRKSRRSGVESGRQMGNIRNKRRRNNGQREL